MKSCNLYILTTEDPLYSVKLIESVVEAFPGQVVGIGFTVFIFYFEIYLKKILYLLFSTPNFYHKHFY